MGALDRRLGRWASSGPVAVALLGRVAALLLALAVLAGAAYFADRSLLHFWHEVGPIYRSHSVSSRLDFSWFFYGMQTAWMHTDPVRSLYSITAQDAWMTAHHLPFDHSDVFGYPPPFALLWSPLASLPYLAALRLWTEINLAALGVGVGIAAWHASPRFGWARALVLAGGALWAQPLVSNFYWGQPNALTLALVALGLFGIMRERPTRWTAVLGGVAVGLATVFKLTPAVILVYLPVRWLLSRRAERGRAALVGAVAGWATVAVTSVAAGVALGWQTLPQYAFRMIPAVERSAWAHGAAPWNQSFRGILMVWPRHNAHYLTHAADLFGVGVFLLAVLLVALRPALDVRLEAALVALLVLLCSPSLEDHHFTVALLPWVLLGGYLLDRLSAWRRLWLLPLAAAFTVASVALIAPRQLHWPPAFLTGAASVPVPAGRYNRVDMLGGATWGPVRFTLRLRYAAGPAGAVQGNWPDWWSPGNPLQPTISGAAVDAGKVSNGNVGLYAFSYPVRPGDTLVSLGLPAGLPQQSGGQEGLHIVAVTLERAGGTSASRFVPVHLPYNARGIAWAPGARVATAISFDGSGNLFWSPTWNAGPFTAVVQGGPVPFELPAARAAANVLSVPAPSSGVVVVTRGGPKWQQVVVGRAPFFLGIALLFVVAGAAVAVEGVARVARAGR